MTGVGVSDAFFELEGACVHSIRFIFAAQVDYPYAAARLADDNPPESLFRRVQAASAPPARSGKPWQTGLTLNGAAFDPSAPLDHYNDVNFVTGIDNLDAPSPETIVLDHWFEIPRAPRTVAWSWDEPRRYLLSFPYWQPISGPGDTASQNVDYSAVLRLNWTKPPASSWVAVSFDAFWPSERDSAEVLIPLHACDSLCPR
ncbi:hypothetical protein Acy02nite_76430 [Actinoplanes cyaneus]|uniref:Uncharacterized protein n=1 Tax=Actinoplanes cyaneus TaxID=52696 RepID=A0A919IR54_9ACTN|nr:hypothetical protein [Actinoplanes cyaneus]MCW2143606.1 hypothetical protein [Actinoplanes cyaneus]GID69762.1 hypothetical protein Acy02nite_76430 [Actinoplanes cyaneus]